MAANSPSTVAAILVAAGAGERLGAGVPKAYVEVGGRTLLQHAIDLFNGHPRVGDVIVVLPPGDTGSYAAVTPVPGGPTRQESVAAGLRRVGENVDFVLVHDVARPFVPAMVIDAVLAALDAGADAVVPVVPIHDTVRRVGAEGALVETVDRRTLVAVQTPQAFRREVLVAAHEQASGSVATDDAGLVEAMGVPVVSVPGAEDSFKITTPLDLARAETVAQLRSARSPSVPGGIS
jgi:2-C-methyl-D-erythritol 4-phosphate cytidylyltransferase